MSRAIQQWLEEVDQLRAERAQQSIVHREALDTINELRLENTRLARLLTAKETEIARLQGESAVYRTKWVDEMAQIARLRALVSGLSARLDDECDSDCPECAEMEQK